MDRYIDLINRSKLQLKFIDLESDTNIYLDISNDLKSELLKIINEFTRFREWEL